MARVIQNLKITFLTKMFLLFYTVTNFLLVLSNVLKISITFPKFFCNFVKFFPKFLGNFPKISSLFYRAISYQLILGSVSLEEGPWGSVSLEERLWESVSSKEGVPEDRVTNYSTSASLSRPSQPHIGVDIENWGHFCT